VLGKSPGISIDLRSVAVSEVWDKNAAILSYLFNPTKGIWFFRVLDGYNLIVEFLG